MNCNVNIRINQENISIIELVCGKMSPTFTSVTCKKIFSNKFEVIYFFDDTC